MKLLIIDNDLAAVELVELTVGMAWPEATVLSASNADEGIFAVDSKEPNLVLLEVDLPDMDGFTACKEIRRFSDVPIIMLTGRGKEADIVRGLDVGADDYIVKPFSPIVFIAKLKAVLRRCEPLPSLVEDGAFEYGDLKVDFGTSEVTLGGRVVNLTPTEYRLLCQLIKNAGKIVSSRTLLGLVWGRERLEETNYLKVHIKHLRHKLKEDAAAFKYIFTERNVGYGFAMTGELANS
jgi:two-component system KDP operon response regulator KdpE